LADAQMRQPPSCFNRFIWPEDFNEMFAGHYFPPISDQDFADDLGLLRLPIPHTQHTSSNTNIEVP